MINTPIQLLEALRRRPPLDKVMIYPVVVDKTAEFICSAAYTSDFNLVLSVDVNEDSFGQIRYIHDLADQIEGLISANPKVAKGKILLGYCAMNGECLHKQVRAIINKGKLKLAKSIGPAECADSSDHDEDV